MKKTEKNKQTQRMAAPTVKMKPLRSLRRNDALLFTPYAWAKLFWFCHRGATEIGGFGITSADDLLLIEDFVTVEQEVSVASVHFEDEAVADFFEDQVDADRNPEQFGRIWCHTHPGDSPEPSGTDEETFSRAFGSCDWAIMFILANGGATYARLRFNTGPGGSLLLPVEVDYQAAFKESCHDEWEQEYVENIQAYTDSQFGLYSWGEQTRFGAAGLEAASDRWPYELTPEDFEGYAELSEADKADFLNDMGIL